MVMSYGFQRRRICTSVVIIKLVTIGRGEPILLLHRYPQTVPRMALDCPTT